jgi:hypothetical protein
MLHDPVYYRQLLAKVNAHKAPCFTYSQRQIDISPAQFDSLVTQINNSGFWQLPYRINCAEAPMDGDGFTMEANTSEKYKVIFASSCIDQNSYKQALQELVRRAGMDTVIHIH